MSDDVTSLEPAAERSRDDLERAAERVKARLLTTLDTLDQRRHDAMDLTTQVKRHAVPVLSVGAAALILVGGSIAIAVYRAVDRRRHKGRERVRALRRLWDNPERTVVREPRSLLADTARKMLAATMSMVAVEVARRAVRSLQASRAEGAESGALASPRLPAPVVRLEGGRRRVAR